MAIIHSNGLKITSFSALPGIFRLYIAARHGAISIQFTAIPRRVDSCQASRYTYMCMYTPLSVLTQHSYCTGHRLARLPPTSVIYTSPCLIMAPRNPTETGEGRARKGIPGGGATGVEEPPAPVVIVWFNVVWMVAIHVAALYGLWLLPWAGWRIWIWSEYCYISIILHLNIFPGHSDGKLTSFDNDISILSVIK